MKIPLARPEITEDDIAAVVRVLHSARLSQGPALWAFERALAGYFNVSHAVAVNSGTGALQLALRALDIKDGDEVILPSFSFMAVSNAIAAERAVPVFVDIDPRTLNMDPGQLKHAVGNKTKALILLHSFGFPAPVQQTFEFARRHSLLVVEDACEAFGAEYQGHKVGTLGDAGIFAFYPNKLITTGEGGALVTNSPQLAERVRSLRNQGRRHSTAAFENWEPGFSYRISDINCALGLQQLSRIEKIMSRREQLAACYRRHLLNSGLSCFPPAEYDDSASCRISWFTYPVLLPDDFSRGDRDRIWSELGNRGIECGRYFAPSHLQPALRGLPFRCGDLTHTVSVSDRILCLPFFQSLSEVEIEFVCAELARVISERFNNRHGTQAAVNW